LCCSEGARQGLGEEHGDEDEGEGGVEELALVVLGVLSVLLELGEEARPEAEETALRDLLPLLANVAGLRKGGPLAEMALTLQVSSEEVSVMGDGGGPVGAGL
jgi:hypothetical protein